jgi:hypothetical protein
MRVAAAIGVVLLAVLVAALFAYSAYLRHPFDDPESARCDSPKVTFGAARDLGTHREVDVRFTCVGAALVGTLNVPEDRGPHPAVVWIHGAGESPRLPYQGTPLAQALLRSGIAFFSYDKRGAAGSEGECCPGDYGEFNVPAADADGAVNAIRSRPEIDRDHIGFLGGSQAGWIIPLATVRSHGHVAFTAIVDGPVVSLGEEDVYSQKTGDKGPLGQAAWFVRTIGGLRTPGPAGFDPRPYLEQLTTSGIWLYGGDDQSQPTDEDVVVLDRLKAEGKDFTVIVYPEAGHGLLDVPPTDPRALPAVVAWIRQHA